MPERAKISIPTAAFFATVAVGVGFNARVLESPPLYLIHLFLAALFAGIALTVLANLASGRSIDFRARELVVVVLIGCLLFRSTDNPRFADAYGALLLLLATYYMFRVLYTNWELTPSVFVLALATGAFVASLRELGISDFISRLATITVETRLGLESLGGNNAYGLLLSVCCVGLLHLFITRVSPVLRLATVIAFAYLFLRLVATLSRGGMVGMVFGMILYFAARSTSPARALMRLAAVSAVLFLAGLAAMTFIPSIADRYNLFSDPTGSGRIGIWTFLLLELERTPLALLFGRGAGSIVFTTPWAQIESAHNSYLEAFFTYGVVGLGAILVLIARVARAVSKVPNSAERPLLWAVTTQLILGAALDSYHGASQIGWIYAAWFAIVLSQRRAVEGRTDDIGHTVSQPDSPRLRFAE